MHGCVLSVHACACACIHMQCMCPLVYVYRGLCPHRKTHLLILKTLLEDASVNSNPCITKESKKTYFFFCHGNK